MKILLTVHQFFPDFSSGTEVLALSVARDLISRGHDVRILAGNPVTVAMSDDERCDEYCYENIRVHRFHHAYVPMGDQTSKIEIGFNNHLAAEYFAGIIADFAPDAVHFFHFNRLGTGIISKAVSAGVPAFFTPTDFWTICPTGQLRLENGNACDGPSPHAGNCVTHFAQSTIKGVAGSMAAKLPVGLAEHLVRNTRPALSSLYPFAREVIAMGGRLGLNVSRLNQLKKIVAPNQMMESLLIRYGVDSERIIVLDYGVSLGPGITGRVRTLDEGPLKVGFIGTLATHKGCHVLIKAFNRLERGSARLQIFGRESDFPDYARDLHKLADDNPDIAFCGTFPNESIGRIIDGLDVLVVPSLWNENTPLVIYSAQAALCPVIASNVPGVSCTVHDEENGLLFEAGDANALTRKMQLLIQHPRVLARISNSSRPPKPVANYVDELLSVWQAS